MVASEWICYSYCCPEGFKMTPHYPADCNVRIHSGKQYCVMHSYGKSGMGEQTVIRFNRATLTVEVG
jgi:hypothetical protein